jgi:5-deoxy-glucuronate isomerase
VITPEGRAYCGEQVSLDVLTIEPGARDAVCVPMGEEAVLVLLQGELEWAGTAAARRSVFEDRASAVYLPAETVVEVVARTAIELALVATLNAQIEAAASPPTVIAPGEIVVHDRGVPGRPRQVHELVTDAVPARHLVVGETFNRGGQWSSFPAHEDGGPDGEAALEEVYYFRCDRPEGFGLQGLYAANGEAEAVVVEHGTVVGIAAGYHPVAAPPGTHLYYLWALAGAERRLATCEDPVHRWVHQR